MWPTRSSTEPWHTARTLRPFDPAAGAGFPSSLSLPERSLLPPRHRAGRPGQTGRTGGPDRTVALRPGCPISRLATRVSPIRRCASVNSRRSRSRSVAEKLSISCSSFASSLGARGPPRFDPVIDASELVARRDLQTASRSPSGSTEQSRGIAPVSQLDQGNPELDLVRSLVSRFHEQNSGMIPLALRRQSLGA